MNIKVVIPAYRVKAQIMELLNQIGPEVDEIIVVDDCCPEESGKYVEQHLNDKRIQVVFHEKNKGVGGAVITGFKTILAKNYPDPYLVFKLDGDGQMDPKLLKKFADSIGKSDYVKGNRFYYVKSLNQMPKLRLFGNSMLSLINKFVNGYWQIMDPTNGYIGITSEALAQLELERLDERYFFESDMLYRLSLIRAKVVDVPMLPKYEDEESSLSISRVLLEFPPKYFSRFCKRIFYNYFLRDFNAGTIQLLTGFVLFLFGVFFGIYHWVLSIKTGEPTLTGTIMIAALSTIFGFQLLLGFLNYDVQNSPR